MAAGYAPDTFGHVSQLPQILKGFRIDSFIFWRGLGDEIDRLGALFWWQAPDGSRVLAVRLLESYANGRDLGRWTKEMAGCWITPNCGQIWQQAGFRSSWIVGSQFSSVPDCGTYCLATGGSPANTT